ncbi:MAG: nucleotidyltransferase family protein [Flavipsychrobacter sp.]|nr:nucleotidyltransferase family protein [Flavipsychrobacter sp.]
MNQLTVIQNTLKQLMPGLVSRYHISSLGLFGSVVRSDFSSQSDIDIMVDFSKPIGIAFIDLANELELRLNRRVDLVSKKGIKPAYFSKIEQEIVYV